MEPDEVFVVFPEILKRATRKPDGEEARLRLVEAVSMEHIAEIKDALYRTRVRLEDEPDEQRICLKSILFEGARKRSEVEFEDARRRRRRDREVRELWFQGLELCVDWREVDYSRLYFLESIGRGIELLGDGSLEEFIDEVDFRVVLEELELEEGEEGVGSRWNRLGVLFGILVGSVVVLGWEGVWKRFSSVICWGIWESGRGVFIGEKVIDRLMDNMEGKETVITSRTDGEDEKKILEYFLQGATRNEDVGKRRQSFQKYSKFVEVLHPKLRLTCLHKLWTSVHQPHMTAAVIDTARKLAVHNHSIPRALLGDFVRGKIACFPPIGSDLDQKTLVEIAPPMQSLLSLIELARSNPTFRLPPEFLRALESYDTALQAILKPSTRSTSHRTSLPPTITVSSVSVARENTIPTEDQRETSALRLLHLSVQHILDK